MITVPVEDAVFIVCALIGLVLLLVTVVFDDILGGLLDALHVDVDVGGTSLAPLLLGFVSMFGIGGLIATQLLDVHGGQAAVGGVVAGVIGAVLASTLFGVLRRSETAAPFSIRDLVGRDASVAVAIPAGRFGSVYVKAEGQTHEYSATAAIDIPSGTRVTVTAALGNGLVVAPIEAPVPARPLSEGGNHGA
jgi:membrane protein implicated in regulation of membrane protease activity